MTPPVRVLIAEDSETQREILVSLLAEDATILVVGQARDGLEAVEAARRLRPDVITMDIQMPRLGGLDAIDRIMAESPSRVIVVCAVDDQQQVDLSFQAAMRGALELIAKPRAQSVGDLHAWGRALRESVHLMSEIPVVRRRRSLPDAAPLLYASDQRVDAVGLVASTGGPPTLATILAALPEKLPAPILIAQHMAPGFVGGLARWLSLVTPLKVQVARTGARAEPGHVYLPPDGHDIAVARGGALSVLPGDSLHCPSADRLLVSLAEAYGPRSAGLVLTGMGEDGVVGTRAICAAGGIALAQDEASCTVFGMPRAALRAGAQPVPLTIAAATIRDLCRRTSA